MLNATYLGGILELFDLDENCRLSLNKTLYIYEPKYGIAEGAIPAYVVSKKRLRLVSKMYMQQIIVFMHYCIIEETKLYLQRLLYLVGKDFQQVKLRLTMVL